MGRRTLLLIASILIAAVGTALIAVYVRGADSRAREGTQQVAIYVAQRDVPAGTKVSDVQSQPVFGLKTFNLDNAPTNPVSNLDSIADLVAAVDIVAGAPLQQSMFAKTANPSANLGITTTKVGASFEFSDPQRVAGLLAPGMLVSIYSVPQTGDAQRVLTRVKVLRVGSQSETSTGTVAATSTTADQVPRTIVTFDLTNDDELKLLKAKRDGDLSLAVLGDQKTQAP